jgi:hypothetical protein
MSRRLSESDAERLWDCGSILQKMAYLDALDRGESAVLGAWGRELWEIVARSGGQPKTRQEVEGK